MALIAFDVSYYTGAYLTQATLHVYVDEKDSDAANPTTAVCRITETLDEMSVTWNNKPGDAGEFGSFAWPPAGEWHVMDITTIVEDWLDGDYPNYGVYFKARGISPGESGYINYASAHYPDSSKWPKLAFTYSWAGVEPASLGEMKAAFR